MTLRVLIVDDEPLVRSGIRRVLAAEQGVEIAGEARHGLEALERIRSLKPDLVFLDVQMPELDGIGVVRALERDALPGIVFVTAYDRYAVEAFELHAIDYLLKPFDDDRLRAALARARERLSRPAPDLAARLAELTELLRRDGQPLSRFLVKTGSRSVLVNAADVDWIEAADNYVRLHAGGARHVLRMTMKELEARLDPASFVRVHRSAIVNLARVAHLEPVPSGDQEIVLKSGQRVVLSRRYRESFERRVGPAL